jgi:hypothetical protein
MVSIAKIDRISIMADAAEAITNGIEESGIIIIIRGMCWFHCKKSVDKQIIEVKDSNKRLLITINILYNNLLYKMLNMILINIM